MMFDVINQPDVLAGVGKRHDYFVKKLNELNQQHNVFADVRGAGLLLGCVLNDRHAGRAKELMQLANKEGLLCLVAGTQVLRLAPSLLIDDADIDEGMARLDRAVARFVGY